MIFWRAATFNMYSVHSKNRWKFYANNERRLWSITKFSVKFQTYLARGFRKSKIFLKNTCDMKSICLSWAVDCNHFILDIKFLRGRVLSKGGTWCEEFLFSFLGSHWSKLHDFLSRAAKITGLLIFFYSQFHQKDFPEENREENFVRLLFRTRIHSILYFL